MCPSRSPAHPKLIPTLGAGSPLLGLHIHHQGDVALNEGEGEEADVATVVAGSHWILHPGDQVLVRGGMGALLHSDPYLLALPTGLSMRCWEEHWPGRGGPSPGPYAALLGNPEPVSLLWSPHLEMQMTPRHLWRRAQHLSVLETQLAPRTGYICSFAGRVSLSLC